MVVVASSLRQRGHNPLSRRRKGPRPQMSGSLLETTADAVGAASQSSSNSSRSNNNNNSNQNHSKSNPKLQELQLAFCLLSRQIQGLDGDGNHIGPSSTGPGEAVPNHPAPVAQKMGPPDLRDINVPLTVATGVRSQQPYDSSPAVVSDVVRAEQAGTLHVRVQDQSEAVKDRPGKSKTTSHPEGRNAVVPAAERGDQRARQLQRKLEAERKLRTAVESALQQLQRRAAESALERERLERVVNSFGGRSLEELTARLHAMEHRLREAEAALAHSQQLASEKAAESLEALEQAASLAESLETERTARTVAEDERKTVTQELRCCLRGRTKAEQEAKAAAAAMKKAEAQRESLTQRLEVLRTANKRLEKRATAAALSTSFSGSTGYDAGSGGGSGAAGDTAARLVTARARLKVLSASGCSGVNGSATVGRGHACQHDGEKDSWKEKAAIDRAVSNTVGEKRWRDKLRKAEMQGEAYHSAAVAAENGLKIAVRQSAELEEVTRILAKKLAHDKYDTKRASIGRIGRISNVVDATMTGLLLAVGADDESKTGTQKGCGGETTSACLPLKPPAPIVEREGQTCVTEQHDPATSSRPLDLSLDTKQVGDMTGTAEESATLLTCSGSEVCDPTPLDEQTDKHEASKGNRATTQISDPHAERCSTLREEERRRQQTSPSPYRRLSDASVWTTRIESVQECESGSRTTPPSPVKSGRHGGRTRPRSASASEAHTLTTRHPSITPPEARLAQQQQQPKKQEERQHQHQQALQKQPGERATAETNGTNCPSPSTSAAPFSALLSESRQLREEALSSVRNGPYRSNLLAQASGGEGDFRGNGGGRREGWRGTQESTRHEAAVASVPIEVLLRLCDRKSARGTRCKREGAYVDCTANRTERLDVARGLIADEGVDEVESGEDERPREGAVEHPARNVAFAAMNLATSPAMPLPPGITPTLAQQVQGAVSRGDEHGLLKIIGRCGSTEKGGIARLLDIDAPE